MQMVSIFARVSNEKKRIREDAIDLEKNFAFAAADLEFFARMGKSQSRGWRV
jgi:hypothetical protein